MFWCSIFSISENRHNYNTSAGNDKMVKVFRGEGRKENLYASSDRAVILNKSKKTVLKNCKQLSTMLLIGAIHLCLQ